MTKEMKKKIHNSVECVLQAVIFDLSLESFIKFSNVCYDYDVKTCINVKLYERHDVCTFAVYERDDVGEKHVLSIDPESFTRNRITSSSKLCAYWNHYDREYDKNAQFVSNADLDEVRKVLFYIFEYLHLRDKRLAKKQRKLQKQYEINAAWEEYDAINASCETRSYLEDFDQAELEWETRLEALRRERRRKETLNLVNYASPVNLACYILFLQDKIEGVIDADVDFYTYLNSEYINFECSIAWNEYFEAEQEIECEYKYDHYYTEEDVEKWFDDHNKYLWDDYEEISYLEDFDDAERELARREVFEMVSNHGIDYLVDYIVDLHEALNH